MRTRNGLLTLIAAIFFTASPLAAQVKVIWSADFDGSVAWRRVLDLDADGKDDLLIVHADGRVLSALGGKDGKPLGAMAGTLKLANADKTVVATGDILGLGRPQLVTLSPAGLIAYPVGDDGAIRADGVNLAPRARFALRVGAPRYAPFLSDVNHDGRLDVLVPGANSCEIWLAGPGADAKAAPAVRRVATIPVDSDMMRLTQATAVSDRLVSRLVIPRLDIHDVNGDGKDDLVVEDGKIRAFHMQKADGTIPERPDVSVDLRIFRDTTPDSELTPGRTLAGLDDTLFTSTDLDHDGIPDYVIAHRRKVWVFHGTSAGPQFTEPSNVLKTADDVTTMLTVDLNDDERVDLVIVKVEVPSVATIMTGFFGDWDIDIHALGYLHGTDRKFQTSPAFKSTLVVRLPSILEILKNPQAILRRFTDASQAERLFAEGDLDGDGAADVALLSKDQKSLEVFRATTPGAASRPSDGAAWLRRVLFDDRDKVWNLDRIIDFIANQSERTIGELTEKKAALAPFALRDPAQWTPAHLSLGAFDGSQKRSILIAYDSKDGPPRSAFDVIR